jgi:hypothetical protein
MTISLTCIEVFQRAVAAYHLHNNVDEAAHNPFSEGSFEHLLFAKNHVDTVQWHLEDIVRDPNIDPFAGIGLKRRIDKSNQVRTDMVEQIDDYFLALYAGVDAVSGAKLNTESPAWAIDRLSILILKIYHMQEEAVRVDATPEHRTKCTAKLQVLLEQQTDLSTSIDELLAEISEGKKQMKVYRQMKMYNDPSLNPVLYNLEKK